MRKLGKMGEYEVKAAQPAETDASLVLVCNVYFTTPGPRTPRLMRWLKPQYSHVFFQIGHEIWDQPWKGAGKCYDADQFLMSHCDADPEGSLALCRVATDPITHEQMIEFFRALEGRKTQRLRTVLRYLGLWPWQAWNCMSPIVGLLRLSGEEVDARTPDELYQSII
jgi:hypothetical protein